MHSSRKTLLARVNCLQKIATVISFAASTPLCNVALQDLPSGKPWAWTALVICLAIIKWQTWQCASASVSRGLAHFFLLSWDPFHHPFENKPRLASWEMRNHRKQRWAVKMLLDHLTQQLTADAWVSPVKTRKTNQLSPSPEANA